MIQALVLCAGFGTRLGEHCSRAPKAMLDIDGHVVVEHILSRLSAAGIEDVFINLHHFGEQIVERIGDGRQLGCCVQYLEESQPKGTGGTVRDLLARTRDSGLLVHYGDILCEHRLDALVDLHGARSAGATILVHQRPGSNSFAFFADDDRISEFHERPSSVPDFRGREPWVFSGVTVLSKAAMASLPEGGVSDLPRDLLIPLAESGRLFGQRLRGRRIAIDSGMRLAQAREAFARRDGFSLLESQQRRAQ